MFRMGQKKSRWLATGIAVAMLGACDGDPTVELAAAAPASGAALAQYSENITKSVKLGANADLVQRFCKNVTSAPCAADIAGKLKAAGFGDGDGVDLAYAFTVTEADRLDGQADGASTPEIFLQAAYKVVVAREPDQEGALVNLQFIKENGERKLLVRSMLQSPEFKTLP